MAQSKLAPHPGTWQLAEAKNKFSEVFTRAIEEGPQHVTRRDEEIVLISREEYDQLTEKSFIDFLLSGPSLQGLDLRRDQSPMRDVEWPE
jgi:prevent-host-death family protein